MTPEEWQRIRPILESALELEGESREQFLSEACADEPLRREVESLLAQQHRAENFLESPAIEAAPKELARKAGLAAEETGGEPARREHSLIGRRISHYWIVDRLASGGMGEVYRAIRVDEQYEKQVAIKVVRPGWETEFILRRFQTERQVLASLEHPNIARLLDAGTTKDGLPYFVMELIEGKAIDEYCDAQRIPVAGRLALFRAVCSAVHYAHQRLVVHRDIKPSNILVTADGVPKLLDFGIAKILHPESSLEAGVPTVTVFRLMTPEYASPEQLRGEAITTATDVYSLGVVLYQVLTGRLPYRLGSRSPHEIVRAVCETEPERPSTAIGRAEEASASGGVSPSPTVEAVSAARHTQPEKLRRLLSGDLDQIVLKAIRKEPQHRYASAEQFSEDIARYEQGRPIVARSRTWRYRSAKFVRRNKGVVVAAMLAVLALAAGMVTTIQARRRAEKRFNDVRKLANSLMFEVYDSIKDTPGTTAARELIIQRAQEYLDGLAQESRSDPSLLRELAAAYGRLADVLGSPQQSNVSNTPKAMEDYRQAVALSERASSLQPSNRDIRRELGQHYADWSAALMLRAGNKAESERTAREAIRILEPLAAANPLDSKTQAVLAAAYMGMGNFLRRGGDNDFPGALEYFGKALAIFERLGAAEPANESFQTQISAAHRSIGAVLAMQKNWPAALEQYRMALPTDEAHLALHPDALSARQDLSVSYSNTGFILVRQGELDAGLEYYLKALKIRGALAAADPNDTAAQMALSNTYNYIGGIYAQEGKLAPGIEYYKKGLALREALLRKDPANDNFRFAVATSQESIGRRFAEFAVRAQKVSTEKLSYCRESVTWLERAWPVFLKRRAEGRQEGAEVQDFEVMQRDLQTCRQTIARLSGPAPGAIH